ncbi:MAG: phospholipase D family protein [Polyangiaceae bacterium]|nr:phospholipase D family protein [Polyangiaceae bacterium]
MRLDVFSPSVRSARLELLSDRDHYDRLIAKAVASTSVSLWIATANVKDMHVEAPVGSSARARGRYISLLDTFASFVRRGVEIRILHAAPPSRAFRATLAKLPILKPPQFEMRLCPRVHMKMIAVDGTYLYLGSANFTGAGLGAKGEGRRNFEMGIATDDDVLLDRTQERFDAIWSGRMCAGCRLRSVCPAPLDGVSTLAAE